MAIADARNQTHTHIKHNLQSPDWTTYPLAIVSAPIVICQPLNTHLQTITIQIRVLFAAWCWSMQLRRSNLLPSNLTMFRAFRFSLQSRHQSGTSNPDV